jgi:peptidoglycan/xylan/chitin deacetylase (PgdA/CDA1 family)
VEGAKAIAARIASPLHSVLHRLVIANVRWQPFGEYFYRVPTSEKVVALTFDDGPLPPYTDQLLAVLERQRVKATFFFVGQKLEAHWQGAQRTLAAGHEIGNHSYSHPHLYYKSAAFIRAQIDRTDVLLRRLGVKGEIPFRAPYGESFLVLPWILQRAKRRHVLFDFFPDPPDWFGTPPRIVADSVVAQTQPGSIIVLHDGNPRAGVHVAEATDLLIDRLRQDGYRFATISELLSLA